MFLFFFPVHVQHFYLRSMRTNVEDEHFLG